MDVKIKKIDVIGLTCRVSIICLPFSLPTKNQSGIVLAFLNIPGSKRFLILITGVS